MNYEDNIIGLEVEKLENNKSNKKAIILYSPSTNNIYNMEYIGKDTNLIKTHLFNKNNNKIIDIVKSYKYSENILETINNLDDKILLNEISIDNVYIFMNKYSNNITDFILYYSKKYFILILLLYNIL